MGLIEVFGKSRRTKERALEVTHLIESRRVTGAWRLAEDLLNSWPETPPLLERLVRPFVLGDTLGRLQSQVEGCRKTVQVAAEHAARGQEWLSRADADPFDLDALRGAVAAFDESLTHDVIESVTDTVNRCREAYDKRARFLAAYEKAQTYERQSFFRLALSAYQDAESLCQTVRVQELMRACEARLDDEAAFEEMLGSVQGLIAQGRYRKALKRLEDGLSRFSRQDGAALQQEVSPIASAQGLYEQGLLLERAGDRLGAAKLYQEAAQAAPHLEGPRLRLGVLAVRTGNWSAGLQFLEALPGEQASYLRGYALAQLGEFQQAHRAWQGIENEDLAIERNTLRRVSEHRRLTEQREIELAVASGSLEAARVTSERYIRTFGADPLVSDNLSNHILPRLEVAIWEAGDRSAIAAEAMRAWRQRPSAHTLHNWMVAAYYAAADDPRQTRKFVAAWGAAAANLGGDPALQDLPWRGGEPVAISDLLEDFKGLLEGTLESLKAQDIEVYLAVRDEARCELVALKLLGEAPGGPRVQGLRVGPGALAVGTDAPGVVPEPPSDQGTSGKLLAALYSPWGPAVAACLEGDVERAIAIRPAIHRGEEAFACQWVAYHEGGHHLQHKRWRQAVSPLNLAKPMLPDELTWRDDLDRLCGNQRQAISNDEEHLEFAQFWFDLLGTQASRSYLAEFRTHQIRKRLADKRLTSEEGLRELEKIKQIDSRNPVVTELIEMVNFQRELEKLKSSMDRGDLEGTVRQAKRSSNERVRVLVAEMCLDMMDEGLQRRTMHPQAAAQLITWAYELCPSYPGLRELYNKVRY